jgi:hypothetical protein
MHDNEESNSRSSQVAILVVLLGCFIIKAERHVLHPARNEVNDTGHCMLLLLEVVSKRHHSPTQLFILQVRSSFA